MHRSGKQRSTRRPGVPPLRLETGVPTAASIPTGWAMITDLVQPAAAADNLDDEIPTAGTFDPKVWLAGDRDAGVGCRRPGSGSLIGVFLSA